MTTATAVTLDREALERFIVEVDALALFDARLSAGNETWLQGRLYEAIEGLEEAVWGEHRPTNLHERAYTRVEEVWRGFVEHVGGDDAR
jgi:hypothetical protein